MDYILTAAGCGWTPDSGDVAGDHTRNHVVVVVVAVVVETGDTYRRYSDCGETGSGRVMVGSRLLRVDAERTMSSRLSPGTCLRLCTCMCVCRSVCSPRSSR